MYCLFLSIFYLIFPTNLKTRKCVHAYLDQRVLRSLELSTDKECNACLVKEGSSLFVAFGGTGKHDKTYNENNILNNTALVSMPAEDMAYREIGMVWRKGTTRVTLFRHLAGLIAPLTPIPTLTR